MFPDDDNSDKDENKLELPKPPQGKKKMPLQMQIESDEEPLAKPEIVMETKKDSLVRGGTTGTTNDVIYNVSEPAEEPL